MVREGATGFLTPVGDATGLAESMAKILRDNALRVALGEAARREVTLHFSLKATGDKVLKVYDTLLAEQVQRDQDTQTP